MPDLPSASAPAYSFQLIADPIVPEVAVFAAEEGAEVQFLGTVRGQEEGRVITGIDYSVYRPMAEKELDRLCQRGQAEQRPHRVFIQHRLGFVADREPSILIRVQTKHSAEAFEICRWYLKEIKTSVPIWKKPVWAEAE
jgi:molybdopterin synthase catalytic subunit